MYLYYRRLDRLKKRRAYRRGGRHEEPAFDYIALQGYLAHNKMPTPL